MSLVETLARYKREETEHEGQLFTTRKLGYSSAILAGVKKFHDYKYIWLRLFDSRGERNFSPIFSWGR